ncbi:MAG: RsiV family protein [Mangrovibacterium sp.]
MNYELRIVLRTWSFALRTWRPALRTSHFALLSLLLVACKQPKELKFTDMHIDEDNAQYSLHAQYPIFGIDTLDVSISTVVDDYFSECKTESAAHMNKKWFRPYKVNIVSNSEVVAGRYISVNMDCYYDMGGVHGMTNNEIFNYDVQNNQFIDTDALFNRSSKRLIELVKAKIKEKVASPWTDDAMKGRGLYNDLQDPESLSKFQITNEGVKFIFDPYEVACYAEGTVTVVVGYDEFPFNIEIKK